MAAVQGNSDDPPPLLKTGLGKEIFNSIFKWIFEHSYKPGDDSIEIIQGVGGKPGLIYSRGGKGSAQVSYYSFQPRKSAWKGTGPDPLSPEQRARTIAFYFGNINNRTPMNIDDEFTLPENKSDQTVNTMFYFQCPLSESSLGFGDLHFDRPKIMQVQGDDLEDAGVMGVPFGDDGSLPAYVIIPLCRIGVANNVPVFNIGTGVRSNLWITLQTNYGNAYGGAANRAARTILVTGLL